MNPGWRHSLETCHVRLTVDGFKAGFLHDEIKCTVNVKMSLL